MRQPQVDINVFKERREQLAQLIPGSALILTAHPEQVRNNDVYHAYRQDSNFYYLTGFEEPESILLFRPGQKEETILFVREKNIERETWEGFRYGPDGTKKQFGVDAAYDVSLFEEMAPKLLQEVNDLYYHFFYFSEFDEHIKKVLMEQKNLKRRSGNGTLTIKDSYQLLGEMRIIKSEFEAEQMRKAAEINHYAHTEVMKATRPSATERSLYGVFLKSIMEKGAVREAYNGIFATGKNATTLHYVFNDQACQDGELFLIDAGPEHNYYASDVTRTFPVSGRFNEDQKRVYNKLLGLQKSIIEKVKPGTSMFDLQKFTIDQITEILLDEKVLKGSKEKLIIDLEYQTYYPHGVGHWLGLDVHDAGLTNIGAEPRILEPGMVVTIEPGLYIPHDDHSAPPVLRGMGIRIEDNILLTQDGHENLTASIPKEVNELEEIIR